LLDNNYRDVVKDQGGYNDVRRTDIAMPVRRWLSGERDIKSLVSNFDKSFTKLGIENNIRKYEPPKPEPDPSILGTDDEKVTQPATSGIEPDNQDDALDLGKEYQRMAQSRTQPDLEREYQRMAQSRTQPTKTSSAAVRKSTDYEEFDASDPRARNPKTFRSASPTYTPIKSTSKYEPEDTDRLDTGSRSPVNYNQQDIQNINNLASRSSSNQPKPKLSPEPKKISTALKEPKNTGLGSYFTQKRGPNQPAASKPSNLGLGSYFTQKGGQSRKQPAATKLEPEIKTSTSPVVKKRELVAKDTEPGTKNFKFNYLK
tara:strand:+ start:1542 stop:2486 length:945 start_codon:yes stop_codon:yes gene_type:complete